MEVDVPACLSIDILFAFTVWYGFRASVPREAMTLPVCLRAGKGDPAAVPGQMPNRQVLASLGTSHAGWGEVLFLSYVPCNPSSFQGCEGLGRPNFQS